MFDINLFGLAAMIRAVLPGMRARRPGFIVNISSVGGLRSLPAIGWFNATKFAVEGLSEALWQEVEPSGFPHRLGGALGPREQGGDADYADTAGKGRDGVRALSGQQAGDPARAVAAIVKAVLGPNPPHHLLLGSAAFDGAMAPLGERRVDFETWEKISRSADFPNDAAGRAARGKMDGMADRDAFALGQSNLNRVLFAELGLEDSGMPLSVVSALARLDLGPWQEAGRLAKLPRPIATNELVRVIASLPSGSWPMQDATRTPSGWRQLGYTTCFDFK